MSTLVCRLAWLLTFVLALALPSWPAHAAEAQPLAEDEAVEQRLVAIADELRCLVCQNESLAGSRAELAQDLRREIRTLIKQGKSDPEVMDFLVSRYGDFVRYRPPLKPSTWLLWIGPFVFLVAALAALLTFLRRRTRTTTAPPALSALDKAKANAMLAGD